MMTGERISEEQLSAWVDGELEPPEAARVEAWLSTHPDDADRVARWRGDADALRSHFAAFDAGSPTPPALAAAVWRRPGPPRWALAASAAGLLVCGALIGAGTVWKLQQQRESRLAAGTPQGWVQRAAFAHSVFTPEPRHAVEVKAQEEHLARWLTKRIEVPVKLFDLQAQGFELVGGRLLPDGPGKSAQLMYQDSRGVRVTVYLRKPEQGADAAFRYERQGDLGLFYWVDEGCGYALVGALPRETLLALAQAIYQQHPQPGATTTPAQPAPPVPAAAASGPTG